MPPTSDILEWFKKEVWMRRACRAVTYSVILSFITLLISAIVSRATILHPLDWLYGCAYACFSIQQWFVGICFVLAVAFISFVQASHHTVHPALIQNRWSYLCHTFGIKQLMFNLRHALACVVIVISYMQFSDAPYKDRATLCSSKSTVYCVNERFNFIIMHAIYVGVITAMLHFKRSQQLQFPIIQQSNFFQVKMTLVGLLESSIVQALLQLCYFYPLYLLVIGPVSMPIMSTVFSLYNRSFVVLDTVFILLDLSLLWYTMISAILLAISFNITALLQNIYQTTPLEFCIEPLLEGDDQKCLGKALACKDNKFIQYLAYRDLKQLSYCSQDRRQIIYSLSQPGGHPHHWKMISSQCLDLLKQLSNEISQQNVMLTRSMRLSQPNGERKIPNNAYGKDNNSNVFHRTTNASLITSPGGAAPNPTEVYLNGTLNGTTHCLPHDVNNQTVLSPPSFAEKMKDSFQRIGVVSYLITDYPSVATGQLFRDCQISIWAVEALSNLVVCSFKEDNYGVVQSTLPDIMETLLTLQESVERHFKIAGRQMKADSLHALHHVMLLRLTLRSALKSAIYKIVNTFKQHLLILDLNPDHLRRLNMFLEYRE